MKRTIAFVLILTCLLTALSGCGKKEVDPRALVDELLENADFTDSLNELDAVIVPMLYTGVDSADIQDVISYAGTGATAEEITVFTAKDGTAADRLLAAAKEHVADRIESFKNYGPAAAMALEDAVVEKSGNHVIVVVCSDSKTAAKIVDKHT